MPKDRGKLIRRSEKQFKKSDESAYSIVPSRMSISTCRTDGQESIRSEDDITYRRLSFEDDLFTARVYKRNYRNPRILRLLETKPRKTSTTIIPQNTTQHINRSLPERIGPDRNISQVHDSMQERSFELAALHSHPSEQHHRAPTGNAHHWEEPSTELDDMGHLLSKSSDRSGTSFEDADEDETLDPRSAPSSSVQTRQRTISTSAESSKAFIDACEKGDYPMAQTLLKTGYDVHIDPDIPGLGAILAAAMYGHIDIVRALLQHGASIEARTISNGSRPLHLAVQSGNISMIRFLLKCGAEVSAENQHGMQPIHLASESGSVDAIRVLVEGGAAPDAIDQSGRQPIHCVAVVPGCDDAILFLANAGADVNALRKNSYDGDALLDSPLYLACKANRIENFRALLILGVDIAGDKLQLAFLLRKTIRDCSTGCLEALLEHGAVVPNWLRSSGITPLPDLKEDNILDAEKSLQLLIRYQANIDAQDHYGDTALHKVALLKLPKSSRVRQERDSQLRLARMLLDNNADRDVLDYYMNTPLYYSINGHKPELSVLLINSGARLLCVRDGHVLRLQVHDHLKLYNSPYVLNWYSEPRDYKSKTEEALHEGVLAIKLRHIVEMFRVSGITLAIGRHDHQAKDGVTIKPHSPSSSVLSSPELSDSLNGSQVVPSPDLAQHAAVETDNVAMIEHESSHSIRQIPPLP